MTSFFAAGAVLMTLSVPAPAAALISIAGSGWGHGVGLSQYGAKAMAADGASYEQIVTKYFTNGSVAPLESTDAANFVTTDETPLWVSIRQQADLLGFRLEQGTADLCFDESGLCVATAQPGQSWTFALNESGRCVFFERFPTGSIRIAGMEGSCSASVRLGSSMTTLHIPIKARSYRNGTLRFRPAPTTGLIQVSLETGIDDFVKGLSEVPETWPLAAIRAQVVASRSYAVWNVLSRGPADEFDRQRKDDCYCNTWDDNTDQVFGGYTGEAMHPVWVAAVDHTAMQVVSVYGQVALGLYSSSSGGTTENYSDVFDGEEHTYLSSVNDSAALSDVAVNPHASWETNYDQALIAEVFGFSWVSDMVVVERNLSGSVRTIRLEGIVNGRSAEKTVSGVTFRQELSLRSTSFGLAVQPRFSDVPAGHQFAGEITGLNVLGVTDGCTPTTYCPNSAVTRGEMAAFLVRALDLPDVPGDPFSDDDGHALEAEIASLAASGITSGCSATSFCPDRSVTRAEMAAFLVRGYDLVAASGIPFSDAGGHYFEAEIASLAASGITSGCSATSFCPDRSVTRAEMAAFLVRALD